MYSDSQPFQKPIGHIDRTHVILISATLLSILTRRPADNSQLFMCCEINVRAWLGIKLKLIKVPRQNVNFSSRDSRFDEGEWGWGHEEFPAKKYSTK